MTDLLLVFLGAAFLENLLLWKFLDGARASAGAAGKWQLVPASLLMLAGTLRVLPASFLPFPPQALAYLHSLAFVSTAMAVATRPDAAAMLQPGLRWLRRYLPLLVANVAVLVFVLLDDQRTGSLRGAVGFCLGASLAFFLLMLLVWPLHERIEGSAVPPAWRGIPIMALTACMMALALSAYRGVLPW